MGSHAEGGTNRGDLQALIAGKKEANIDKVSATLPHSEFLEQSNIRTVCTRGQFASDRCSIYGQAEAVAPLLDQPLKGSLYRRSSGMTHAERPLVENSCSKAELKKARKNKQALELAGRGKK